MHHIILPPALVVAAVFEDVFPTTVFQIVLLLPNVLVTVCILLMHVHQFVLLDQCILPSFAKLAISHRQTHQRRL